MKSDTQLRHEAKKQGYALKKSRSSYSGDNSGGYMIMNTNTGKIEAGEHFQYVL